MPKKSININLRQILISTGLVLILYCFTYSYSAPRVNLLSTVLPSNGIHQICDKPYLVSNFLNHDILDELQMAEEIISDDDVLENSYKINYFVLARHFDTRQAFFIEHRNSVAHNRHLYLLYCSWRHYTSI